jgi:hypothetical protein
VIESAEVSQFAGNCRFVDIHPTLCSQMRCQENEKWAKTFATRENKMARSLFD